LALVARRLVAFAADDLVHEVLYVPAALAR
jgi:hypothetical protein